MALEVDEGNRDVTPTTKVTGRRIIGVMERVSRNRILESSHYERDFEPSAPP